MAAVIYARFMKLNWCLYEITNESEWPFKWCKLKVASFSRYDKRFHQPRPLLNAITECDAVLKMCSRSDEVKRRLVLFTLKTCRMCFHSNYWALLQNTAAGHEARWVTVATEIFLDAVLRLEAPQQVGLLELVNIFFGVQMGKKTIFVPYRFLC